MDDNQKLNGLMRCLNLSLKVQLKQKNKCTNTDRNIIRKNELLLLLQTSIEKAKATCCLISLCILFTNPREWQKWRKERNKNANFFQINLIN